MYNKIKTISAKGVEDLEIRVIDFNRLFVYIHTNPIYSKKAWVIADGDTTGKDCISKLKNNFNSWPENHFLNFSKENFEEYYPARFQDDVKKILELPHKEKREGKKVLIKKVMEWALSNRSEAIVEFNQSANEVIEILKTISTKI